nr:hypothetical protein [Tanacetum cinerariifolium]
MGTVRDTLAESTKGAPQFGLERPRVYSDPTPEKKDWIESHSCMMTLNTSNSIRENPFITTMSAVKLNRGLRDSNYDQLYTYLKQHETHAQENKMMLDRFSQPTLDPLALMSNVSNPQHYSPSFLPSSSAQVPQPIVDSSLSPAKSLIENLTNTLALLTQSYKTFLPQTNNQLRTSSNARNQATVQDGRVNRVGNVNLGHARSSQARHVKCYNCNDTGHIARNCTQPKRPQNSEYFKDKMLLMQVQENEVALDEKQLLFLAGGQDKAFDNDVDEQPGQDLSLNVDNVFQADDYDAFDSNVDEAPTGQTMFMANLLSADPVTDEAGPSYDSDILSEVQDHEHYQDAVCAHHEEHVMHDSVQLDHVVDSYADYTSDSNMISYDQHVKDNEAALYNGHEIIKDNHTPAIVHNTEDTLEIDEITRKKINDKINDPECVSRKGSQRGKGVLSKPINVTSKRKKQDTVAKPSDKSDSNTHIHVVTIKPQKTNVPVPPSTGVKSCPNASGSQPKRNPKTNRISPAKGVNKLPVEDHPRTTKSHLRTLNRVDSSSRL